MWWLLVPVIGAVVAAVAGSDDEEKEASERRARIQARDAKAQAEAQAVAGRRRAELEQRKSQLVADAGSQLGDLFATHTAVLDLSYKAPVHVSFDDLKTFATKEVPVKPKGMLKHLEAIAPHAVFSPSWKAHATQTHALQKEITGLQRLKEELLG